MLQKLLQIAGVSSKEEFYKKYPTEEAFFRAHPQAKQLLSKKSQQSFMIAPQAMYGGMAYGGHFLPRAKYGMEPQGGAEPVNSDYPTYEAFKAAHDNWLASQQEQANNPTPPEEMQQPTSVDANGYPVSVNPNAPQNAQAALPSATPAAPATSFKLNDYQGVSVYDFLSTQGKAGDYKSRKKLAQALGMSNYKGTPTQNADMMEMIRQNPDILSSYDDATAPQATVTRTAAQTQNKKAAPTTAQLSNSKSVAASKTRSVLDRAINPNHGNDMIRRNIQTQQWEPVLVGSGPTMENLQRMQLAKQKNAAELSSAASFPQFKQSNKMGGEPCYNCGGMYDQGGMYDGGRAIVNRDMTDPYGSRGIVNINRGPYEGRVLVNNYSHGGYYGNVPQHGNPGVYADGDSGTFNGGQSFAFGGFLGDVSQGMRDGSLQALAGSVLPMANIYQDKLTGSPITGEMTKLGPDGKPVSNSNLKDDLTKYLSNLTGEIKKEDLQGIVGKYALGGMASQGYIPEYGSQSYGGFAYGGVPLPQYNMGSGYYPEGGEVSPEDQAAMDMQQAQQSAPPQEGGAPEQGGDQMDPQQIIQAVSQMVQQGMQPQEIMQQLAQMGIPEDQAQQLIEVVMQQMQGGQEGQPQEQGMQEEMMEGSQGQEAPMQEAMEGQAPPMGRWGGRFDYGGYNITSQTTEAPVGVGNLRKFTGQSMMEPSMEAMYEAAMQRPNVSTAGGYGDQVAQDYARTMQEASVEAANHRMQRQMELEQMNRNQPYYNINPNIGGLRQYPPMTMPQRQRQHAEGGSVGEEMDVTPEQMEYLRKQGYKFDII